MATADTVIIVNPRARGGYVGHKWPRILPELRSALGPLEARFTESSGDATRLCREALAQGAGLVLALGGDGTASQVVAGFFPERPEVSGDPTQPALNQAPKASFGFLPCGTGGDLRRTFDTPTDLARAAAAVMKAQPRPIDVGQLDYTHLDGRPGRGYFINIASCGIGGVIDDLVNRSGKWLGGSATFFAASVKASLRYRNQRVRIQIDDDPAREERIYSLAVANGRYFGGGMKAAPDAQVDDGLFDVLTMGDLTFAQALLLGGYIYRGTHLSRPKISMTRARRVAVTPVDSNEPVLLDVDGETPGRLPATFTNLPRALSLRL